MELAGRRVRLRPFRQEEFETVWAIHRPGHRASGRSLIEQKRRLRQMFCHSGRFDAGVAYLAIEAAGVLIGEVDARRVGPTSSHAFEVGIELYDPARRGAGLGGEAFDLWVGHLFERRGASRLEASTALENMQMRRLLAARGFVSTNESASHVRYVCTAEVWQKRS